MGGSRKGRQASDSQSVRCLMVATLNKVQYNNVQFKETYSELNCRLVKQGWFLSWHPHRTALLLQQLTTSLLLSLLGGKPQRIKVIINLMWLRLRFLEKLPLLVLLYREKWRVLQSNQRLKSEDFYSHYALSTIATVKHISALCVSRLRCLS